MKLVIYFSLALIFGITACKNDSPSLSSAQILGSWISTENHVTNCSDESGNGTFSSDCPSNDCRTFTFVVDTAVIDNQTVINQYYSYSIFSNGSALNESGTFSLGNGVINLCTEDDEDEEQVVCRNVNINLNGDQLIVFTTNGDTGCEEQTTYARVSN